MAEAEFGHCQARWFELCGVSVQSRRVLLPELGMATVVLEAGRGEPLLLIHGGGGLADDWAPLAAQLQDQFRLLMVYLPGHGLADPVDFRQVESASFRLGDGGSSYHTMLRQLMGTMSDIRNAVANLQAPVLILWGDRDCFGPPDNALEVCEGHGHARVELLHDAGHLPWFDCPELVARFARELNAA